MFYNWEKLYPLLQILKDNISVMEKELSDNDFWIPWPEKNLYKNKTYKWDVIPLLYTFPSYNIKKKKWIKETCYLFPNTVSLLKNIPNIRTALFSKMGPETIIESHTGWGELSNYVLRCHIPIFIPDKKKCGLSVCGNLKYHNSKEIICFDDSKIHNAFNFSSKERIVLIVDILRPSCIKKGNASFGKTKELNNILDLFN